MTAATMAAVGVALTIGGGPAQAASVSGTLPNVACLSNVGTQLQNISFAITAPDSVAEGETFTVTFPGGAATLPSTALGGSVSIQKFENLSSTYRLEGGATFVPGTIQALGDTTNNGNVVSATASLQASDTEIKFTTPGPLTPGSLVTPDRTVSVVAPAAGATIEIYISGLTTTAFIGAAPPGTPVAVNCVITKAIVQTQNGVLAIPVTEPDTSSTSGEETTTTGGDTTTTTGGDTTTTTGGDTTTTTGEPTTTTTEAPTTTTTAAPTTTTLAPTTTTKPPATTTTTAPAIRSIATFAVSIVEGNGAPKTLRIPLILDKVTKAPIMISVKSNNNGTADQEVDFDTVDTVVTIAAGKSRNTAAVMILPDTDAEALSVGGYETIKLRATILPGSGPARFYNGNSALTMTGIIVDDDKPF